MVTVMPTAPLDGAAVLPDELVEQYVKPSSSQVDIIDALRLAALDWIEGYTAKSLERREWIAVFDTFDATMSLPRTPVRHVSSLLYVDAAGATVDGSNLYRVAGERLLPMTRWPIAASGGAAVSVTFEAGFDDVAVEAPGLQVAALMLIMHLLAGGSLANVPATVSLLVDVQHRTPVMG